MIIGIEISILSEKYSIPKYRVYFKYWYRYFSTRIAHAYITYVTCAVGICLIQDFVDFLQLKICAYNWNLNGDTKSSVGSGVGGHAVAVQALSTSQSSQNPVVSNKVTVIIAIMLRACAKIFNCKTLYSACVQNNVQRLLHVI